MRVHPVAVAVCLAAVSLSAQETSQPKPAPTQVRIVAPAGDAVVGQTATFRAEPFDAAGARMDLQPTAWFATPFDVGAAEPSGAVTFFAAGELTVGAIVGGKVGTVTVRIKPQAVARLDVGAPTGPIMVGGSTQLVASAFTAAGVPRASTALAWSSDPPAVAQVDAAGVVTGVSAGRATIRVTADAAVATLTVTVVRNPVGALAIEPRSATARTGDVVRFSAVAKNAAGARIDAAAIRWSASGGGASIDADGGFVADRPGAYVVTAVGGDRAATASVVVTPRNVQREFEVVGRAPVEEFQVLEQWIVGNYAYVTSAIAGRLWVYDISNPAAPVKVDSLSFDARVMNDISISADGTTGVLTREGASNRKNGIVILDTSDLAHPKVLAEYTESVTGGVHSAFIDGQHVYLTDDATGSLRVVSIEDPRRPKEVARWQTEPLTKTVSSPDGQQSIAGRYLHDVYVKDGLAYLAYWRDGLVILDVGAGIAGGSPRAPKLVSQFRINYHELYGPGWLAGAHTVFRNKNYVFVGDEVFPPGFDLVARDRIPVKGIVHVLDVSDIARPREVAVYEVPEGGAHNVWIEDDVMYMGYYSGGARAVDVSGELRGDLYRQGREIARLWTGDPKGYRPNLPFAWGAQPHRGLIYFNDINSGIWITRLKPAGGGK